MHSYKPELNFINCQSFNLGPTSLNCLRDFQHFKQRFNPNVAQCEPTAFNRQTRLPGLRQKTVRHRHYLKKEKLCTFSLTIPLKKLPWITSSKWTFSPVSSISYATISVYYEEVTNYLLNFVVAIGAYVVMCLFVILKRTQTMRTLFTARMKLFISSPRRM